MNFGIITPVYAPAPGGGALYTRMLAEGLAGSPGVESVRVITEAYPNCSNLQSGPADGLVVDRWFPCRAGKARVSMRSYWDYGNQNVKFMGLARRFGQQLDAVLVHSSFHYKPSVITQSLKRIRKRSPGRPRLVLDVRDPLFPVSKAGAIAAYDQVICCADNVVAHMQSLGVAPQKLHRIPIPFERPQLDAHWSAQVSEKLGLSGCPFLLFTNGISRDKGFFPCIEATRILRNRFPGLVLAVVGRRRDWDSECDQARNEGLLKYLGIVSHDEVTGLLQSCLVHLAPSPVESIGRGSLEALAVGARALLPPNVPEFVKHVPDWVTRHHDSQSLASQVSDILDGADRSSDYPFETHRPDVIVRLTLEVLSGGVTGSTWH